MKQKVKPYCGEVVLIPANDRSVVKVVIKTTKLANKVVNIIEEEGFVPKPIDVPFDAWIREITVELKQLVNGEEQPEQAGA